MNDSRVTAWPRREAELLEHLQHRRVLGQYLRNQLLEPGLARENAEMAHQDGADALSLIRIHDDERDFGLARRGDDISPAAGNDGLAILVDLSDEGDMLVKIDVDEEVDFLLR